MSFDRRPTTVSILTSFAVLWTALGTAAELPAAVLTPLATDLAAPTVIASAGDHRLFIALREGLVVIWDGVEIRAQPFLDIRDRVRYDGVFDGLYSLAFHPDYARNGTFFALYVDTSDRTVVSRFRISSDPDLGDPASEVVLLSIDQSLGLHDGNHLALGPDGYLYVSTGDSGPGFDPLCLAQSDDDLQGKILRLDVDAGAGAPPYFSVPPSNPFAGQGGPAELVWAKGLRNPWRFSFDRATGDLWIGDPGEDEREEVNLQPAASAGGENYGWKVMEGTLCHPDVGGCDPAPPGCDAAEYTPPVIEYAHGDGQCAVIGGYVYRGARVGELAGAYLYGDFCSGKLFAARHVGGVWQSEDTGLRAPTLRSFGEDAEGELYVVTGDAFYRLDPSPSDGGDCVGDATTLCLNDGRFEVRITWRTLQGTAGEGQAVSLTGDAGFFWFFSASNPEIFVKVLRACADPFNRYWVFAAGLTDVETSLTVVDTRTGAVKRYDKPLGAGFDPIRDTTAFATCP